MTNFISFVKRIEKGAVLNIMVNAITSFSLGFASYYFKTQGLEFYKIVLVWAISPLASLPVVFLVNKWNTLKFLRIGVLGYTGAALSLLFYTQFSYILFGIFSGLVLGLFWVSFNTVFFAESSNNYHAKDSSLYFIFPSLAGTIMPPLGALFIDNLGFRALFFAATLLSFLPLFYIKGKYFDHSLNIKFKDADKAFSGIRLIAFFDGSLHFFQWHFLTIYILLFLKTEYEIGGLLSYLGLISLLVSFLLSYASDRFNKRVELLYPLLLLMGVLILIMPSLHSLSALLPIVGLYAVLDNLSLPIRFAVHMDMANPDIGFWRASEFYGNLGRTIVFGVTSLLLYMGNYWAAFAIFSVMTFVFPFIISRKINSLRS